MPEARFESMAAFLADPATHGGAETERIDTHTAAVVLAGDRAFKLRRPVDYGWLDYSTTARRRAAADREIAENARGAPGLYIGIGGIVERDGGWRLADEAAPDDEPIVLMHRFDGEKLFDRMAGRGALDRALLHRTGQVVADMHKAAPVRPAPTRLPDFARNESNALRDLAPVLGQAAVEPVATRILAEGARLGPLAEARPVKRCHGDLHLRNIVLWQERPAPFDCIDFNDAFTDIDPLYDLAFLLMDLDHRGLPALATACLNAWAERMAASPGGDTIAAYGGFALFPFYKACRAAIRAKVLGLAARDVGDEAAAEEARSYLALAGRYLAEPAHPQLIAVGGLSGSGKSTLARALSDETGAVVLRSDAIRKGLWGAEETDRLPPEAYARKISADVYAELCLRAGMVIEGGASAILDAAHLRAEERDRAEALAGSAGVPFTGLWLDAPLDALRARVSARKGDVSDADAAVVTIQSGYDLGTIRWTRLQAGGPPEKLAEAARTAISQT